MLQLLRKMFDTSDRDVKAVLPIVDQINALEPEAEKLSDSDFAIKTQEFRTRLQNGESLEQILPEAFAIVREVSRRTLGMRHFDVQMIGGIVLHQGRIAEMKTGEGKTLVAVAPMYLNAISGRGSHLVTVNDYLARRDAVWMGPIYHTLGLTVGIIQGQSADSDELGGSYLYTPGAKHDDPRYMNLVPCTRREAYSCDITYGTNHEFGFDYLRDNMAYDVSQLVMRELNFAIIDEVDSILIDEARTPHIISGPSTEDVSIYKDIDKVVKTLQPEVHYTADKKNHSAALTEEGMDHIEEVMGIENIASDPKLFHHFNASVKAYALFDKNIDYVVRNGEVVIVDENTGRMMFGRRFSDGLHQALEAKEGVNVQRESQTVAVITFQNLFRLYNKLAGMTGTAKTEEDEFRKIYGLDVVCVPTHRPMIRVDQDDIVFKTEEAKFRGIAREILRLYSKQQPVLVGTRSIEMSERVSKRLTAEMLQKLVALDRLLELRDVKKTLKGDAKQSATDIINMPLADIKAQTLSMVLSSADLPSDLLSDDHKDWFLQTHGLDESKAEHFREALKHGIPHNVLNAKYHEREALIISEAGRKGAVTIATNMAGRGVDILLGGRVADEIVLQARQQEAEEDHETMADEYMETYASYRRGGMQRAAPPLPLNDQERVGLAEEVRELGGLYILGTERHESRRIDNQLRGRSGRQGDPGESRFYVSLEDMLWKIFNAKMLENPLLRAWPEMEEVKAGFLSKMILKTQERIENHFFEARKHVLEYDDVLNSQREHIYGMRREILLGRDVRADFQQGIRDVVSEAVTQCWDYDDTGKANYNYDDLYATLNDFFPLIDYATPDEVRQHEPEAPLAEFLTECAMKAYDDKIQNEGEEKMRELEKWIMLRIVNDKWMDHLQIVEYIREGIGLRGYGQVDPLVAYKRETYDLFQNTVRQIRNDSVKYIYQATLVRNDQPEPQMMRVEEEGAEAVPKISSNGVVGDWPTGADPKKVSRNDPCPCGSGKKFKVCHYPKLRSEGVI